MKKLVGILFLFLLIACRKESPIAPEKKDVEKRPEGTCVCDHKVCFCLAPGASVIEESEED